MRFYDLIKIIIDFRLNWFHSLQKSVFILLNFLHEILIDFQEI